MPLNKFAPMVENQGAAFTDGGGWLADDMMDHLQGRKLLLFFGNSCASATNISCGFYKRTIKN